MIELLMNQFFQNIVETIGSPALAVLLIMALIFGVLLFCGLEFDFALIILSPIPYGFYKGGYIEVWITALFIIIPLGVGIWNVWLRFSNK